MNCISDWIMVCLLLFIGIMGCLVGICGFGSGSHLSSEAEHILVVLIGWGFIFDAMVYARIRLWLENELKNKDSKSE